MGKNNNHTTLPSQLFIFSSFKIQNKFGNILRFQVD